MLDAERLDAGGREGPRAASLRAASAWVSTPAIYLSRAIRPPSLRYRHGMAKTTDERLYRGGPMRAVWPSPSRPARRRAARRADADYGVPAEPELARGRLARPHPPDARSAGGR